MMNIFSWSGIPRGPYAKSPHGFALWIFFHSLVVWLEQQDVSCFTISLVMFLQEIKMNQREISRTTQQNLQQTPPDPRAVVLKRKLQVGRLWHHHENWSGAFGGPYLHDQNLPFLPVTGRWETGVGRWCSSDPKKHRIHVDLVYLLYLHEFRDFLW